MDMAMNTYPVVFSPKDPAGLPWIIPVQAVNSASAIASAPRERREEARHMRIFRTATEFFGQTRAVEITYEPDRANPPSVVIHAITLVRQICKRGEYWYDQNGNFHAGPHYERTEVSGQLDAGQIQAIGEEVIGYATAYRRGRN